MHERVDVKVKVELPDPYTHVPKLWFTRSVEKPLSRCFTLQASECRDVSTFRKGGNIAVCFEQGFYIFPVKCVKSMSLASFYYHLPSQHLRTMSKNPLILNLTQEDQRNAAEQELNDYTVQSGKFFPRSLHTQEEC